MARRTDHNPKELSGLILQSALSIVENHGVSALSTRKIASNIGYTVGTIYQYFKNKHALILALNAQTLAKLEDAIQQVDKTMPPKQALLQYAKIYVDFAQNHQHLWSMLFNYSYNEEYFLPEDNKKYIENLLNLILQCFERLPNYHGQNPDDDARLLWASVHSLCTLHNNHKLGFISQKPLHILIEKMVEIHIAPYE